MDADDDDFIPDTAWGRIMAKANNDESGEWTFVHGTAFHEGALRCLRPERLPSGLSQPAIAPGVCCLAFAAELYLKALHAINGKTAHGHKLANLFSSLPEASKNSVVTSHQGSTGRDADALQQDLAGVNNSFVEFRYVFETQGRDLHVGHLQYFTLCLFNEVLRLKPNWAPENRARFEETPGLCG